MRLFVAAEIPGPLRERLAALQRDLRDLPLDVRWVRPAGIHLTLRFIGEVAAGRLDAIRTALAGGPCAAAGPFALRVAGVGVFPERGAPRVLWAGLSGDLRSAAALAAAVESALAGCGFPPERRPFTPHLTLGRVRKTGGDWRAAVGRFAAVPLGDLRVARFHLYESHLGPGGATYDQRATFDLSGGNDR